MPSANKLSMIYMGVVIPLIQAIPLSIGLYKYRHLEKALKVITWYLLVSLFFNVLTSLFAWFRLNNMPLMHLYTIVELLLLGSFYSQLFMRRQAGRAIALTSVLFLAFCVLNMLFFQHYNSYNSYSKSIEAIIIIIFSMTWFIWRLEQQTNSGPDVTLTYINSGLLVYFASSLIFFIIYHIDTRFLNTHLIIWNAHATFLLLMFILFSAGLWKYKT